MDRIRFGVIVPQGWLNDLPKANTYKQFELAKNVAITAKNFFYSEMTALYWKMNSNHKSMIALLLVSFLLSTIIISTSAYGSSDEKEWKTAYTVGKFLNSEPAEPDQIFKIQYRVINGTIEKFNVLNMPYKGIGNIITKVNSGGNGILEIKFPRNYPYTNEKHLRDVNGDNAIVLINRQDTIFKQDITDCFFVFSIPFTGSITIELVWALILIETPHHGDGVPDSCIPQTVVKDVPVRNDNTIAALHQFKAGVAAEDILCKEGFKILIRSDGKPFCVTASTAKELTKRWD
jgi:hypothetical protein